MAEPVKRPVSRSAQGPIASSEGRRFLESLLNAQTRINTWRYITIVLTIIITVLLYSLVRMSQTIPVRLIPYEVATANAALEVGPHGEGGRQYLAHIAEADLALFTTWRADTVGRRFGGLTQRMTPALHARQASSLRDEAARYESSRYYQVFYPSLTETIGDHSIRVTGVLKRWSGTIEVLDTTISYVLSYQWHNGVPMLDNIEPEARRGSN